MQRLLTVVVLATALGLGACGSGGDGPDVASADGGTATAGSGSAPTSTLDRQDQALKFAQCMREHGIDMDDPGADGRITIKARPGDDVDGAQKACAQYSPMAGADGKGPQLTAEDKQKALDFAKCMRAHGVDMPDPDFSGGGVRFSVGRGPGDGPGGPSEATQEKVEAAQKACQTLLPDGGPQTDQKAG